jgi:hypothetical protein
MVLLWVYMLGTLAHYRNLHVLIRNALQHESKYIYVSITSLESIKLL